MYISLFRISRRRVSKRRRIERGSVLAVAAIGMLSAMLIGGMAIDVSHLYLAKIELQNAADAAALAGAAQLNSTSGGIALAVAEATKVLNKYDVKQNVTIPGSAVTFAANLNGAYVSQSSAEASPANIRFVKVVIAPKPIGMSLSSTVLGATQNVGATAVGGLSVGLTTTKFYTPLLFIEPTGDSSHLCYEAGNTYTLGPKKWNSHQPDTYRVMAGSGGDLIVTGTLDDFGSANNNYMVQQLSDEDDCRITRIGINTRFADYSWSVSTNATSHPPDTIINQNISYATYREMQGDGVVDRADGVMNRRVITVPIAETSGYKPNKGEVTPDRFAAFFILKKMTASCDLEVEAINDRISVPVGEYQAGKTQFNELSIPILYK